MFDRHPPGGLRRGGVHRLPAGLRYPRGIHPARPVRCLNSRRFQASRVDSGLRVASQKSGAHAGETPSQARQHTFRPEKEPENNGLAVFLRPTRRALARKNPSPNGVRRAFSTGVRWAPALRQPVPPDPSRTASSRRWLPVRTPAWTPEAILETLLMMGSGRRACQAQNIHSTDLIASESFGVSPSGVSQESVSLAHTDLTSRS
jgi:hypothetical protein